MEPQGYHHLINTLSEQSGPWGRICRLHINEHVINLVKGMHLWILGVLRHLVDLPLDCLLDEFGPLHFNCVDDAFNVVCSHPVASSE